MQSFYAYHTDVGIKKKTNQDSLLIKEGQTEKGRILLMVICDGMGGLDKGEIASASLIHAFDKWFEDTLPSSLGTNCIVDTVKKEWNDLIQRMNHSITNYGVAKGIQLGTTVTAILFLEDGNYIIGHVGDTRAYCITEQEIVLLTTDHTFIHREVSEGRMTEEQAKTDSRRNMLLQCVGASQEIKVDFVAGQAKTGEVYMLCCDGFRHVVSNEEIQVTISPSVCTNSEIAKNQLVYLTETNKQRGEVDNITALLAKMV